MKKVQGGKKIAKFDFDWTKEYMKDQNAHSANYAEKEAVKKKINEIIEVVNQLYGKEIK